MREITLNITKKKYQAHSFHKEGHPSAPEICKPLKRSLKKTDKQMICNSSGTWMPRTVRFRTSKSSAKIRAIFFLLWNPGAFRLFKWNKSNCYIIYLKSVRKKNQRKDIKIQSNYLLLFKMNNRLVIASKK